ncbi:MAG: hypothetical protein GY915_07450 [bacterium]|nr:hypothetical protein [bacterium]
MRLLPPSPSNATPVQEESSQFPTKTGPTGESTSHESSLGYNPALSSEGAPGPFREEFPGTLEKLLPQGGLLYVQGQWRDVGEMALKGSVEEKILALEYQLVSEELSPRTWREKVRDLDLPIEWAELVLKTKGRSEDMAAPVYRAVLVSLLNQGGEEQRLSFLERLLTPEAKERETLLRFLMRSVEEDVASFVPTGENLWFAPVAVRVLALSGNLRELLAWNEILSAEDPALGHSLQPYFWVVQNSLSCEGFDSWLRSWVLEKGEEAGRMSGVVRALIQSLGKTLDGENDSFGILGASLEIQTQFVTPLRLLASQGRVSELKEKVWKNFYRPGIESPWNLANVAISSLRSVGLMGQAQELAVNALISYGI